MKTPKHSLRKIVNFLNNPDEDGGFWLPNIQRPFVWSEEQTCRLFDSILREYPISTLLVWKTKSDIRCRKFIDNFRPEYRDSLSDFFVPQDTKRKCLVLDGQQRLQSLFIGLKGSYEGRELSLTADRKIRLEPIFGWPSASLPKMGSSAELNAKRNDASIRREGKNRGCDRAV
jgi:uncharacterized protein with ParB-like and HNH nuclease domain